MPEVHFEVRWPDGARRVYYSPSTAIHAHLSAGQSYTLAEFVQRSRDALHAASERVRSRYGYYCSSAMDTLAQIEETALGYAGKPESEVSVVAMDEP